MNIIITGMDNDRHQMERNKTMLEIDESLVMLESSAIDSRAVIMALAEKLSLKGFVSEDYGERTWEREQQHPTGLPTRPFSIAFPHADATGVNRSALALATLKEPVLFKNMGDPDEDLSVHIVLILANKSPEEQIQTLRNLALLFGQPEKLADLRAQSTAVQATAWLKRELGLTQAPQTG